MRAVINLLVVPEPQRCPDPCTWRRAHVPGTVRDVVFVDGVRTPFGKAGPKGIYAESRADDLVINCIPERSTACAPGP